MIRTPSYYNNHKYKDQGYYYTTSYLSYKKKYSSTLNFSKTKKKGNKYSSYKAKWNNYDWNKENKMNNYNTQPEVKFSIEEN